MTEKKVKTEAVGMLTPRERLWAEIRKTPEDFVIDKVAGRARMSYEAARDYVQALSKAGYIALSYETASRKALRPTNGKNCPTKHFHLVKDVGSEAPALTKNGTLNRHHLGPQAMWVTLRICGAMDFRTLALNATTEEHRVTEAVARDYLRFLNRAGYLDIVSEGTTGKPRQYRLKPSMNTGPS